MISIDVIIPTYRLQGEYLVSILKMDAPSDTKVRYLIIADNPSIPIPPELYPLVDNNSVIVYRNEVNKGAHKSRNVGLDNSTADWILFLDDDIKPSKDLLFTYCKAISEYPFGVGFFGETLFPPPSTSFTKGVIACDILTFFFLAGYYDKLKWSPTANVIIKRSAIGEIRFQDIFPKNGGGEDIDFFLKIHRNTNQELKCLKNAPVYHDWWYGEKRNYSRFTRWSFGDSLLHDIFPEYTYYNFPNIIECMVIGLFISILLSIYMHSFVPIISVLLGIIVGEVIIEFTRLFIYKGFYQSQFALESALIRASNDIGRLYMQLVKLKRVKGVGERFDHFCDGKHIPYQRVWAGIKFISYLVGIFGFYSILAN